MPKRGRPRTLSLSPEKMVELGKEMVAYVKDPKNKCIHLSEFYTILKGYTYDQWTSLLQCPEIIPYYEQALRIVGLKYINGTINNSIAQRFLRIYFPDLKRAEDEKILFEHQLKLQSDMLINEKVEQGLSAVLNQIKQRQDSLRIVEIKPSNDK
jgi:predicted patatin/cPLA2 family phospholipase